MQAAIVPPEILVRGDPRFATLLSFAEPESRELAVGVVFAPVLDRLWYAVRGHGAVAIVRGQSRAMQSPVARAVVPSVERDCFAYDTVDPGYERRQAVALGVLARIGTESAEALPCGLAQCELAEGRWRAYGFGRAALWDYAAGSVIVEELGGAGYVLADGVSGPEWVRWSPDWEEPSRHRPALFSFETIDALRTSCLANHS